MKTDITEELTNHIFNSLESDSSVKKHTAIQKFFKNKIQSAIHDFFKDKICIVHDVDDVNEAIVKANKNTYEISDIEKMLLLQNHVLPVYEDLESIFGKNIIQIVVEDEIKD